MRNFARPLLTAIAVCGLLLVSACDSADTNGLNGPLAQGEGNVSVSGSTSSSFSGQAIWSIFEDEDEDPIFGVFVLRGTLADWDEDDFEMVGIFGGTAYTAVGEHSLGGELGAIYARSTPSVERYAWSTAGTLRITTSTATRLVGSTSFTGPLFTGAGGSAGTVSVQAQFDAVYVDPDDLPEGGEVALRQAVSERLAAH